MDFTRLNNGSQPSLNLSKGNVLDLTKQAPALKNCVLGWGMAVAGPLRTLICSFFLLVVDVWHKFPQDVIFFNNISAPGIRLEGITVLVKGDGDERIKLI